MTCKDHTVYLTSWNQSLKLFLEYCVVEHRLQSGGYREREGGTEADAAADEPSGDCVVQSQLQGEGRCLSVCI